MGMLSHPSCDRYLGKPLVAVEGSTESAWRQLGALTLLIKVRPANAKQAIIARELALRLMELSSPPDGVHTPGIAHGVADELSRVYVPKGTGVVNNKVHPTLEYASETQALIRNEAWYRALQ